MKTFDAFVKEEFDSGVKSAHGYAEVYKNPSLSECALGVMKGMTGTKFYNLGAIINNADLYVWDRDHAEHREVIAQLNLKGNVVPIYLQYYPDQKLAILRVASFSMSVGMSHLRDKDVVALARQTPAFKVFSKVDKDDF